MLENKFKKEKFKMEEEYFNEIWEIKQVYVKEVVSLK